MRSACSRANAAGSAPPISRWPVSRQTPTSVSPSRRSTSAAVLEQRAGVRVDRERQTVAGHEIVEARQLLGDAAPLARVERERGRPRVVGDDGRGHDVGARGCEEGGHALGLGAGGREVAGVEHERHEAAGEAQPVAREQVGEPCRLGREASRRARARSRAGRASPSHPARARERAGRPSRAPRRRPTRSARRPGGASRWFRSRGRHGSPRLGGSRRGRVSLLIRSSPLRALQKISAL